MSTKSELRQKQLFLKDPILKAVLRVSLPAIIIALMAGLYAFADQIMMVNLIPKFLSINQMYSSLSSTTIETYNSAINQFKDSTNIHLTNYDTATVIRTAVAYSAPVTVLINAAALLIGNGTGINYTRYNGQGNYPKAQSAWTIGFWSNMMWSIIVSLSIIALSQVWVNLEQGHQLASSLDELQMKVDGSVFTQDQFDAVKAVYTQAYKVINQYATRFMYIIGAGAIFAIYSQFLSLLIISEGKQIFAVSSSIICNLINILFDWILIQFAMLAMIGGAVAMVLGWSLNCMSYLWYIWYMERHGDTNLHLGVLGKMKQIIRTTSLKTMLWSIFSLGLPSFLRNISMALATTVQLALLAYIIGRINHNTGSALTNSDYQDIYGAVNPIYNLFYTAIVGVINGARITCAYNYGAKNMKRVRQSYWILCVVGLIWGTICLLIVGFGLSTPMLHLFNIGNDNIDKFNNAKYMLWIALGSLPIFGSQMGGMMLFQATNRWWRASICGIMQGIICNLTISFAMMGIAIGINNINVFLWNPFVLVSVAVIAVVLWSAIYMHKHFKDIHKTSIPQEYLDKLIYISE